MVDSSEIVGGDIVLTGLVRVKRRIQGRLDVSNHTNSSDLINGGDTLDRRCHQEWYGTPLIAT